MAFQTFDVTYPPDTQAANLLGADIRGLTLATQQRMAAISGSLVSRWNPGSDPQPTNWTGLLFFATDTNQIFQWNGGAWVDITSSLRAYPYVVGYKSGSGSANTGNITVVTIPASGMYRINGHLQITQSGSGGTIQMNTNWTNGVLANSGVLGTSIPASSSVGSEVFGNFGPLFCTQGTLITVAVVLVSAPGCQFNYQAIAERLQ